MFELSYINEPAPLVGETEKEMLPVVNEYGEVVARAGRKTAHERRLLHPVVRICLINRAGNIFLQKRSAAKEVCPGMWDSAIAGHVVFGESLYEAILREAEEELGFTEFNPVFIDNGTSVAEEETELVCTFAAVGNFSIDPHNEEVETGAWWTPDDIDSNIGKHLFTPAFEREWKQFRGKFFSLL